MSFSSTKELVQALKAGEMVALTDDEDRENEGDLVALADRISPEQVNFMLREARGILCLSLSAEYCKKLELSVQTQGSAARQSATAFTETIDSSQGITTGVSALDRWKTIRDAIADDAHPRDLVKPGHVQPLRARSGGVLVRPGHTEASVDLARLCGAKEAAVIIEIMNEDGSMARLPDLIPYKEKHGLKLGSITDLVEYRRRNEKLVERIASSPFPTPWGEFTCHLYKSPFDARTHLALVRGIDLPDDGSPGKPLDQAVMGRVHAECLTSDVFQSTIGGRVGELQQALKTLGEQQQGFLLYMRQGERGESLAAALQAFHENPGAASGEYRTRIDERNYGTGAQILVDMGIRKIRLLSDSEVKRKNISGYNLEIVERLPFHAKTSRP